MTIYLFDGTMDGLLTAVFDAFSLKEQPEELLTEGDALPLFCEHTYQVTTDDEKARRVWTGLEKKLTDIRKLVVRTERAEHAVVPICLQDIQAGGHLQKLCRCRRADSDEHRPKGAS